MPGLVDIINKRNQIPAIALVLRSLQDQPKLMLDLERLYFAAAGIPVTRDSGGRVRGETVWSCSRIGTASSAHFKPSGHVDTMMWVGYLDQKDNNEFLIMRPGVRDAIKFLGWFGAN